MERTPLHQTHLRSTRATHDRSNTVSLMSPTKDHIHENGPTENRPTWAVHDRIVFPCKHTTVHLMFMSTQNYYERDLNRQTHASSTRKNSVPLKTHYSAPDVHVNTDLLWKTTYTDRPTRAVHKRMVFPCKPTTVRLMFMSTMTEEIEIQIITTAKISNKFSKESPYMSNTFSRESPQFQINFHVSKRSPRHSKDLSGKLIDLEI